MIDSFKELPESFVSKNVYKMYYINYSALMLDRDKFAVDRNLVKTGAIYI